jgi:hypothetical protein
MGRYIRAAGGKGGRRLTDVLHEHGRRVVGRERRRAGEHLVGDDAEGVEVAAAIDIALAERLLGRHVGRRANRDAGDGDARTALRGAGDPEVGDEHAAAGALDEDVVGLDVTVHDTVRMRVGQGIGDVPEDPPRLGEGGHWLASEALGETLALDQPHDEVGEPAAFVDRVDGDDVRMIQLRGSLRLAPEPLPHAGVEGQLRRQHLDRNAPIEAQVAGRIDHGHAPAADLVVDQKEVADRGHDAVVHGAGHMTSDAARPSDRRAETRLTWSAAETA